MNRLSIITNTIAKTLNSKSWDIMYSDNDDSAERVFARPYNKSSIVYTCISTTGRAISQVPLLLMQKKRATNRADVFRRRSLEIDNRRYIYRQYPNEPLMVIERSTTTGNVDLWEQAPDDNHWQQLLNKPNYLLSGQQFKEALIGNLLLDGNVWIIGMPFSTSVIPDSLWIAQKKHMGAKRNKATGHIEYWEYDPTGQGVQAKDKIKIYLDERIAHSKLWNPEDPVMGLSPLEPGKTPMMGDWKASKYNEKVFDNDGTPGGSLETDQKMQPPQVEKMRNDWKQEHQGYKKAHRLAILHSGLKYHQTAVTNRDMEYMDFRRYTRDEIIQILGMKKGIISITEDMNRATLYGQKEEWWESTNIPHCKNIESAMDTGMLKDDPNQKFMFDLATVKALQGDFSEKTKQAKEFWAMGVEFNEINRRLELGFGEIEGGDTGWLPYSVQPVAFSLEPEPEIIVEPAPAIEPPEEDEDEDKTKLLISVKQTEITDPAFQRWEKRSERIWKRITNQSNRIERPFKKKLQSIFFEMRKNILSVLHHGVPGKSKSDIHTKGDINIDEINRYNFLIERELLKKSAKGYFDLSIVAGAESIIDDIGEGDLIPANDPVVTGYITAKQTKIVSVVDTIKLQLEKQMRIGISEGEDVTLLEQRIKKTFGLANNRAAVIARTEMGGAMNFGRTAQINRSSYKFKIWYTAQDERVRGADDEAEYNHVNMHGEKLMIGPNAQWDVDGDFIDYPGDYKGAAGNIINCRCIEVVDTES